MNKTDFTLLGQHLNSLAEVYEKKPVTVKALEIWYDTLKDFPTEHVMGLLIGWPKTHTRFPAPAELWKVCAESAAEKRERKAQEERVVNSRPFAGHTEESRKFAAKIRELLSKPKPTAKEHWRKNLEVCPPGSIGHQYACEVLKVKPAESDQVPF